MRVRVADWPELMPTYFAERATMAFAWGKNDCALFSADWVFLITGFDPAEAFRGRYSTAGTATRALKRYGSGSLFDTWSALMGDAIAPLMAQRGDVVGIVDDDGRECLGIVAGDRVVAVAARGVLELGIRDPRIMLAWRV